MIKSRGGQRFLKFFSTLSCVQGACFRDPSPGSRRFAAHVPQSDGATKYPQPGWSEAEPWVRIWILNFIALNGRCVCQDFTTPFQGLGT